MNATVEKISFSYDTEAVLRSAGIKLVPEKMLGIIGPNGSGKSTMLKCINRILVPDSGKIIIDGHDAAGLGRKEIAKAIGYVPQQSSGENTGLTVFEIVMMGRHPYQSLGTGKKDENLTWGVIEKLNLTDLSLRMFNELSGGEKQKVLIARALNQNTGIILLDEPTSSLDIRHQIEIMELLQELSSNQKISICTVIHDLDMALRYCDEAVMMKNGEVYDSGLTSSVITEHNIRDVFGVETIIDNNYGRPHIIYM